MFRSTETLCLFLSENFRTPPHFLLLLLEPHIHLTTNHTGCPFSTHSRNNSLALAALSKPRQLLPGFWQQRGSPPQHFPSALLCLLSRSTLFRGAWGAQSVRSPTSAQVMISWFVGSSPASGSVLNTCSEPGACLGFCVPSFSLPLPCSRAVSQK